MSGHAFDRLSPNLEGIEGSQALFKIVVAASMFFGAGAIEQKMRLLEESVQADTVTEIDLADVDPADRIVIETRNSLYQFSVMDASQRCGILSGGSFTEGIRDAILMGMLSAEGGDFSIDHVSLKTDSRAFFYIKSSRGVERLITSPIISLMLIKDDPETHSLI